MLKLFLYKNGDLVLEKVGQKKDNILIFENIIYNLEETILIREDDNFKYILDFDKGKATITIKDNNYTLDIRIKVLSINKNDNIHEIIYDIESEELIENKLIISIN